MKNEAFRSAGQRSSALVIVGALALSTAAIAPARAADDGQGSILGSLMSMVGLQNRADPAAPKIDYSPRAPLVLPRSTNLPPPTRSAAAGNPAWPKDPDAEAARRAAALARAPAEQGDRDPEMSVADMKKDRAARSPADLPDYDNCEENEHECDPAKLWASLRLKKGDPGAMSDGPGFVPGKEPVREYLTQPPRGYMTPTHDVKRTWELPKNREADDNANVYWMKQAGHKVTDDAPSVD